MTKMSIHDASDADYVCVCAVWAVRMCVFSAIKVFQQKPCGV